MGYYPSEEMIQERKIIPNCKHLMQVRLDNCAPLVLSTGIHFHYKCCKCGILTMQLESVIERK